MDDSYDAPNDADLSISELSLAEKPSTSPVQPFSLLARPRVQTNNLNTPPQETNVVKEQHDEPVVAGADGVEGVEEEAEPNEVDETEVKRSVSRPREEHLKQDLFVLRKLNAAFAIYNDALEETRNSTTHVSEQLKETNALLNKYMDILGKSEATTRLIFDERWRGAEEDEASLARLQRHAEEKVRQEAIERAAAAQREKEKRDKETRERAVREERERIEAEKREKLAARAGYGGVRGVRGTRASMRGAARGAARGAVARVSAIPTASSIRGRPSPLSNVSATSSGGRTSRPASSASVRSATSAARAGTK